MGRAAQWTCCKGHVFHETCAVGRRILECPECGDDGANGNPWRTYCSPQIGPDETVEDDGQCSPPPAACWRRVVQIEKDLAALRAAAAEGAKQLDDERARADQVAATQTRLQRDIVVVRDALGDCRQRSLRNVVAHGASTCFSSLLEADGEPQVSRQLHALQISHGHALQELFQVHQQVLSNLQTHYGKRLARLQQLRLAEEGGVAASSGTGNQVAIRRHSGGNQAAIRLAEEGGVAASSGTGGAAAAGSGSSGGVNGASGGKAALLFGSFKPTTFAASAARAASAAQVAADAAHATAAAHAANARANASIATSSTFGSRDTHGRYVHAMFEHAPMRACTCAPLMGMACVWHVHEQHPSRRCIAQQAGRRSRHASRRRGARGGEGRGRRQRRLPSSLLPGRAASVAAASGASHGVLSRVAEG